MRMSGPPNTDQQNNAKNDLKDHISPSECTQKEEINESCSEEDQVNGEDQGGHIDEISGLVPGAFPKDNVVSQAENCGEETNKYAGQDRLR